MAGPRRQEWEKSGDPAVMASDLGGVVQTTAAPHPPVEG